MNNELVSGVVGAVIGGFFSMLGLLIQQRNDKKSKLVDDLERKINVLNGVRTEISQVTGLYKRRVDDVIKEHVDGTPLEIFYKLDQDYFTFYENNSSSLSVLSKETMDSILTFYITCKGLIDSYDLNTTFMMQRIELRRLQAQHPDNEDYKNIMMGFIEMGIHYAGSIKLIHREAVNASDYAIHMIDIDIEKNKSEIDKLNKSFLKVFVDYLIRKY